MRWKFLEIFRRGRATVSPHDEADALPCPRYAMMERWDTAIPNGKQQRSILQSITNFVGIETMERTFLAIKPDGVQRGLVGNIISRLEQKGFQLVGLKLVKVTRELAEQHYDVHREKPFFSGLVDFLTSGPVIAMVWEGDGVVASARKLIGATNPLSAEPGTIRGDYGVSIGRNIIHGSDAVETAQREIALWFAPEELAAWQPVTTPWLYE